MQSSQSQSPQSLQSDKKPKRLSTKKSTAKPEENNPEFQDQEFVLPEFELNLGFFLSKKDKKFTPISLLKQAFGESYKQLTPNERVFVLLTAMQDLGIVAPLEIECKHCGFKNPVAVDLFNSMKIEGTSLSKFYVQFTGAKSKIDYIFEFTRPQEIREPEGLDSSLASIGVFMLQWLTKHNQSEHFDIFKMNMQDFIELVTRFGRKMFGITFETTVSCANCKQEFQDEFELTVNDLTAVLNEI